MARVYYPIRRYHEMEPLYGYKAIGMEGCYYERT